MNFAEKCFQISDSPPESYLAYAVETESSVDLYMTDVSLEGKYQVLSLEKEADLANMILIRNEDELVLYWSYKNSSIGRYHLSKKRGETKKLSEGKWIKFD